HLLDHTAPHGETGRAHEALTRRSRGALDGGDLLLGASRPGRVRSASGTAGRVPERVGDQLGDPRSRGRRPNGDRVGDHPPLRPAVGDEHGALDAEEWRATQLLVVEDGPDAVESRLEEEVGQRAAGRTAQLLAEKVEDERREALEEL